MRECARQHAWGGGEWQSIVCSSSSSSATITTTPLSLSLSLTYTHAYPTHTPAHGCGVHAVTPAARLQSVEARLAALCLCQEPCLEAGGVLLGSSICLANRKPQRHQQHAPRRHGEDCSLSTYRCRVCRLLPVLWKQHGPTLGKHCLHVALSSL